MKSHAVRPPRFPYRFTRVAGYEGGVVLSNAVLPSSKKGSSTQAPRWPASQPEPTGRGLEMK
jgi:hypothetical protein